MDKYKKGQWVIYSPFGREALGYIQTVNTPAPGDLSIRYKPDWFCRNGLKTDQVIRFATQQEIQERMDEVDDD